LTRPRYRTWAAPPVGEAVGVELVVEDVIVVRVVEDDVG
jgi:hypothetical protein